MTDTTLQPLAAPRGDDWLKRYYFARAAFSVAWIVAALTVGRMSPAFAMLLLVIYPAWDAFANVLDAWRNGGLRRNPSHALNVVVSVAATIAVAVALGMSMYAVLGVFGAWAILSGLLQLVTAARRWKNHGAQWAMMLSGAQSMLAGLFFITQASGATGSVIVDIVPYVAFGAFYFLVSALWLTVSGGRRGPVRRDRR